MKHFEACASVIWWSVSNLVPYGSHNFRADVRDSDTAGSILASEALACALFVAWNVQQASALTCSVYSYLRLSSSAAFLLSLPRTMPSPVHDIIALLSLLRFACLAQKSWRVIQPVVTKSQTEGHQRMGFTHVYTWCHTRFAFTNKTTSPMPKSWTDPNPYTYLLGCRPGETTGTMYRTTDKCIFYFPYFPAAQSS